MICLKEAGEFYEFKLFGGRIDFKNIKEEFCEEIFKYLALDKTEKVQEITNRFQIKFPSQVYDNKKGDNVTNEEDSDDDFIYYPCCLQPN